MYLNNEYADIASKTTAKTDKKPTRTTQATKETTENTTAKTTNNDAAYKLETSTDTKETSNKYPVNQKELAKIVAEAEQKSNQLITLTNALFKKQSDKFTLATSSYEDLKNNTLKLQEALENNTLTADAKTIADAKADIAEDGYYGVEKTSDRLVDFAKALSGGDPSKIELLRDSVIKGFSAVSGDLNDKLPDICKQTFNATMDKFDSWAEENGMTLPEVERM